MKHFLRKKLFSVALLFVSVVIFGGVAVVYGQNNLTIDKDIILSPGRSIKFPDSSTLNSATGLTGGAWTTTSTKIYPQAASYVGIGTTNPTSPLYVVGTTTIAGILQVGAGGGLGEAATSTIIYRSQFVDSDNTNFYLDPSNTGTSAVFAGGIVTGELRATSALRFNATYYSDKKLYSPADGALEWYTNNSAGAHAFRISNQGTVLVNIDSSGNTYFNGGNVGIGTASPTQKLEVTGNIINSGSIQAGTQIYLSTGMMSSNSGSNPLRFGINDSEKMRIGTDGNVGIGLVNPTYKLQVAGVIYADEGTSAADIVASKIDGITFDPVYTIEGNRYATYNPGMVGGVKEEFSGIANLNKNGSVYSYVIDLNSEEKGSDAWLFAHTIDVEKNGIKGIAVLLTPNFDGKAWYEKNEQTKQITLFAIPSSNPSSLELSYRLTASRFDSKDWTNYSQSEWEGLNLDTYYKK